MYEKGIEELEKAKNYIHGGVKKMNLLDDKDKFPVYFVKSKGAYTWDIDVNKYVDFISGKGSIILGYAFDDINNKVKEEIDKSNIMPLSSPIQNNLADKIINIVPCAERVRLFRTGSCATSALIRLARTYTGKEIILTSGYHGWHDNFLRGNGGIIKAVEEKMICFKNSLQLLKRYLELYKGKVAAIFITPEPCFFDEKYYLKCYELSRKYNCLFLLDEVKTGFRNEFKGFQSKLDFVPDGATFSKAMSNGYPISAVAAKEEIMASEDLTHLSGTFDTETSCISAAIATLNYLENNKVNDHLKERGRYFSENLKEIFNKYNFQAIIKNNDPTAFHIIFADEYLALEFYRKAALKGVLFYYFSNVNLNYSHSYEILNNVLDVCESVVKSIKSSSSITSYKEVINSYMHRVRITR